MSFSLLHKLVAYLISGLGLWSLSLGQELSGLSLGLIFVGYVASWFAEDPIISRPRYASAWTAAVVLFLLYQLARAISTVPTLAMAIEFAAFLQISRLFNRRTAADYQQIAVLAFLHLIAATVLSTSLSYALLFVGFVIATPWMLALSHLRREIEGNYPAATDVDPQARTAIQRVLASRRVVGPSFLLGTALLSVPLFAMTLAIFVTIPRVGKGFLSFRRDTGQKVAGFGNQVELGGFGVIRDDPTVVLRVTPLPTVDEKAPRLTLRMRGTSFDRYDGRRWTRSPSTAGRLPLARPDYRVIERAPDLATDERFRIVLDHLDEPVIFLPAGTVAFSVPPRVENGRKQERRVHVARGLDVRYGSPDGLGLIYTAFVDPDGTAAVPPRPDDKAEDYLQVPPGHGRVAELARRIAGDAQAPVEMANRIERFLKEGEYQYSLKQPEVGDRLPLEVFLFEAKRGHCEYYSSAMAIMLRTLGVPTRNVTGFVGGRYNPYGGYYALRQGDAHSWVEVFSPERGWLTYDPTPATRAAMGPDQGLWADLNAIVDALRTRWTTSVVGYDLRTQVGMVRKLYRWLAQHRDRSSDADDGVRSGDGPVDWRGVVRAGRWPALLIGLAIVLLLLARIFRGKGGDGGREVSRSEAQAIRLYRELERQLARRGHARPPSTTPTEHARALSESGFPESDAVRDVTDSYVQARYGHRELSAADLDRMSKAIDRVRSARQ
ncbi:MAG: transglutaminaseTgpA domain-containing protein [Myxococcales bacterium]